MILPNLDAIETIDVDHVRELREQVANDSSLFNRLYSIFVDEGPELVASLRTLVPEGDHDRIHEVIHKVKGSAAAMGAKRLHALSAAAVEICRAKGDLAELASIPDLLEAEYERYAEEGKSLL